MHDVELRTLSATLADGEEVGFFADGDDLRGLPAIVLRRRLGRFLAQRRSGVRVGAYPTLDAIGSALAPVPAAEPAEQGNELEAMCSALAAGEEVGFYGVGETERVGTPRLVLWIQAGLLRLRHRAGEDHGAFGSLAVALRYMRPLMALEAEDS